jgi:hypothetical protein
MVTMNLFTERVKDKPKRTAAINASPAPVVSISSEGGIFSAVPASNLPLIAPIPSALILRSDCQIRKYYMDVTVIFFSFCRLMQL